MLDRTGESRQPPIDLGMIGLDRLVGIALDVVPRGGISSWSRLDRPARHSLLLRTWTTFNLARITVVERAAGRDAGGHELRSSNVSRQDVERIDDQGIAAW